MNDIDTRPSSYATETSDAIELRLGADLAHLPIIRSVVGNVATRMDFDLDTIADLRLAVDEACTVLIRAGHPNGMLVCWFSVADEVLRCQAAVPTTLAEPPSAGTFGWHVLNTLTDSARSWIETESLGGVPWLHIELTKSKW